MKFHRMDEHMQRTKLPNDMQINKTQAKTVWLKSRVSGDLASQGTGMSISPQLHRLGRPSWPPEPSASGRRSDTGRPASSPDSLGSPHARKAAGVRRPIRHLRPVLAPRAAVLLLLVAPLPFAPNAAAQTATAFVSNLRSDDYFYRSSTQRRRRSGFHHRPPRHGLQTDRR